MQKWPFKQLLCEFHHPTYGSKLCSIVDRNIICLTNDNLINIVNPKIDSILPLVPRVESLIKQVENLSSQLTDKFDKLPKEFQDPSMTEYSQQLKRTAEAVIVTASTVIESQSTIMGGQEGQKPSSSTPRVLSEDLKKRKIEEWFSHLTVSHEERRPEYDTISELTPDDSISKIGLNKDKRPQQMDQVPDWSRNCPGGIGPLSRENVEEMDEAGMPGSSPGASKSAGTSTNMSTGGKNPIKNVFVEGFVSRIEDNYSASEEYVDPDTISENSVTQYRMDHKVDTSYNEKSAMELLADLGTNPEAEEWIVNDVLLDLAKMEAGQGVRSSSNIVGTLLYLLEIGADINAIDAESRTPLHYASMVGSTAVVERLVERNADINVKDKYGRSALHIAASMGHTPVVEILLKSGFDIEQKTEEHQRTALALAARAGRASTVKCLLKAGTSIDAPDCQSWTPLHGASIRGWVGVVEILLKAGALIEARDYERYTPLHYASVKGHVRVVEILLKAGASVDAQDYKSWTPLHWASANGYVGVVEMLLKAGALIEARDYEHYTPLHCASAKGHVRVVEALLKAGAYNGWTAWMLSAHQGHNTTTELLHAAGAHRSKVKRLLYSAIWSKVK